MASVQAAMASEYVPVETATIVAEPQPEIQPEPQPETLENMFADGPAVEQQPENVTLGYMRFLFEPDDYINPQAIHQTETYPGTERKKVDDNYMLLKDFNESHLANIHAEQNRGWNIYIAMNAFTPGIKSRKKEHVKTIRNVYLDIDKNGPAALEKVAADVLLGVIPEPHCIIESSPGKFYLVWRVDGFNVQTQEALNKQLCQRYGADEAATDASRVLRLPGTRNLKYDSQPVVKILKQMNAGRYTPVDFKIAVEKSTAERAPIDCTVSGPKIPFHSHDITLTRIAGKLRRDGMERDDIFRTLDEICQARCENVGRDGPQMCMKIAQSVCKYKPEQPALIWKESATTGQATVPVTAAIAVKLPRR